MLKSVFLFKKRKMFITFHPIFQDDRDDRRDEELEEK